MSYDLIDRLLVDICDVMERMMESNQIDPSILQNKPKQVKLRGEKSSETAAKRELEMISKRRHRGLC